MLVRSFNIGISYSQWLLES